MIAQRGAIAFLLCTSLLVGIAASQQDVPLRVGFSTVDVTPDITKAPAYLAGFGKNRKATKIHDPILARAVVLEHGDQKLAFVSVDLVGIFHDVVETVRPRLKGVTYLCVTATHNHHGPDTIGMWGPNLFTTGVDPAYMKQLENAIVAAVEKAGASLAKVHEVRIGQTRDADLLRDSRQPIVKHDELTAVQFIGPDKKTLGIVTTWNCHPEALPSNNPEMSADYVAATVKHLQDKFQAPVVYLTGTVGGLMTPDTSRYKDEKGNRLPDSFEATQRYGIDIGKLTEKALTEGRVAKITPFEVTRREIYLPIDNNAFALGFRLGVLKRNAYGWSGDVTKSVPIDKNDAKQKLAAKTEIARLKLGDLDIAAIPGEIYPELVLGKYQEPADPAADFPDAPLEPSIYSALKGPFRMVIGLANDEIGYIIPKRQWDEKAPFAYGRKSSQYGEINSLGQETAPLMNKAFIEMVKGK
jgi:hypothetical protein